MSNKKFPKRNISRRKFLDISMKGGLLVAATPALLSSLVSCRGGNKPLPSIAMDKSTLSKVIAKALERGGDFADVYLENRISREISMEESIFTSGVYGIRQGAGVRVICGEKTGFAYADDITEESLMRAAEVASYVARNGGEKITPVDLATADRKSYVSVEQPLEDIADKKRTELMERADQAALDYDPKIKMTEISYNDQVRTRVIANSEGLYLRDELPMIMFIVNTLGDDGNRRHMGRQRESYHSGFEMFDNVSPEKMAQEAARESVAMLEADDSPAGTMDVVMENGWGGVLVHEAVGHPLEADNIAKGIGAFTGKLGEKVAAECFTMVDDGTISNYRGTINFDDEGTPAQKNVLIENGVLKGYMTDILSGKQLDMKRTGNGRRQSYRDIPIPRMTNTFIQKGTDKPNDIIASTDKGLYVQSLGGGSVNPITGQFNFTCREAYIIENGKKTKPVRGATLVGSCMDIVSNVDAVGDDLDFGPGFCGKGGQTAEVTVGQPTVRIRGINVGGSRA